MDQKTAFVTLCVCVTVLASSALFSRARADLESTPTAPTPEQIRAYFDALDVLEAGVCPCPGDSNCDGIVDFDDITTVLANWGSSCCPIGASCDDGDPCTIGDTCVNGVCIGMPMSCDDFNPCTIDSCVNGVCQHTVIPGCCLSASECDDGDPCTIDTCEGGVCVNTVKVCDDGNPCTADTCNPVTGQCEFTFAANGTPCGAPGSVCMNGVCTPLDTLPQAWRDWILFQNDQMAPNE